MALDPDGRPSGPFLDELNDVADDARDLASHLVKANMLPAGFPTSEVNILCEALTQLPTGTVKVAVETLDIARERIPILRSDYLPAKNKLIEEKVDPDAPPSADRGGHLDKFLKTILASVTTAISVYEREAGVSIPQEVTPEEPVSEEEAKETNLAAISENARSADEQIGPLKQSAQQIDEEAIRATMKLALNDLSTRAKIAAAETGQPRPKVSLLKKAGNGLKASAEFVWDICCNADKDLAPAAEAWGKFQTAAINGVLTTVRIVCTGIDETVKAIGKRRAAKSKPIPPPDDETREQWEKEAAVQIVMGQPIPAERRQFLQQLSINGDSDDLFEALKEAGVDLSDVYIDPSAERFERKLQVSDLAPLKDLTKLTLLDCASTQVSDLAPLKDLTQLLFLNCERSQVSDLTPLKDLTQILSLFCNDTQISDLTPLIEITQLIQLICYNTQVSDLESLKQLTQLEYFDCDNTHVSDLTPLKELTQLTRLLCQNTQVTDWSPVDHIDDVFGRPKSWKRKPR